MVATEKSRQRERITRIALLTVGAAALLALAATTLPDAATIIGNVAHRHGILSSFGTYATIAHPAHYGSIITFGDINKHGMTVIPPIHAPKGATLLQDTVGPVPTDPNRWMDVRTYYQPAGPAQTVFTPFSLARNVQLGADSVLTLTGLTAAAQSLRRRVQNFHNPLS